MTMGLEGTEKQPTYPALRLSWATSWPSSGFSVDILTFGCRRFGPALLSSPLCSLDWDTSLLNKALITPVTCAEVNPKNSDRVDRPTLRDTSEDTNECGNTGSSRDTGSGPLITWQKNEEWLC